jgi:hypothetical protein
LRSSPFFNLQAVHLRRRREDVRAMAGVARQSRKANFNEKGELYSRFTGFEQQE